LTRFKLIRKKKITFPKKLVAIFNPTAGRRNDVRPLIDIRFELHDIKIDYLKTTH
jgi:hypothetical protein